MPSKSRKTFCQLVQEGCGEAGASHLVPAAYRARFREAERTIAVPREALEEYACPGREHAQCLGIVANVFWAPGAGSSRRTRSVTNPIRHSSGRGRPNRLTIPRPAFLPRPRAPRSFRVGQPAIVRSPSCPGVFRHPRARAFPVQNRPLDPCCSQRFPHDHQQRG